MDDLHELNNVVYVDKNVCMAHMMESVHAIAEIATWQDCPEEQINFWFDLWLDKWVKCAEEYTRLEELEKDLNKPHPEI